MIFIGWFFAYMLRHIAGYFAFFVATLVLFLSLYLFMDRFLARKKAGAWFKGSFLVGLLLGLLHAQFLQSRLSWSDAPLQRPLDAKILMVSARSFVGEISAGEGKKSSKIRFLGVSPSEFMFPGQHAHVSLRSCTRLTWGKQLFYNFEILQGISQHCYLQSPPHVEENFSWLDRARIWAHRVIKKRLQLLAEDSLAAGFLLAETEQIPPLQLNLFRKMGIAHIFSASGLHVGILTGIVMLPFSLTGYTSLGFAVALPVAFFYLVLLDFRVSLLRAFLFLLFFVVLRFWDKKSAPIYILLASTFLMELYAPLSMFTISYVLSAGITLAILYLFPFYSSVIKRFSRRRERDPAQAKSIWHNMQGRGKNFLIDHSALTLAAFSGSLFLSYLIFDYINALSLLYNFIVVPFSGVYLSFCLLLFVLPAAKYLVSWGDAFFYGLAEMHHWFFDRFFPTLLLPFMYYYLALALLLLLWGLYLYAQGKVWTLKKYGYIFFSALVAAFFLQFPANMPKDEGYYVFPYGALHYQRGDVKIYGSVASFLNKDFSLAQPIKDKPLWSVQTQDARSIVGEEKFFGAAGSLLPTSSTPALIRFAPSAHGGEQRMLCIVFQSLSSKKENYWQAKEIAECNEIVWVVSKKFRFRQEYAQKFFARFGFTGRVHEGNYFRWNKLPYIQK